MELFANHVIILVWPAQELQQIAQPALLDNLWLGAKSSNVLVSALIVQIGILAPLVTEALF